jgi:hypothetical protein
VKLESITTDGHKSVLKAIKKASKKILSKNIWSRNLSDLAYEISQAYCGTRTSKTRFNIVENQNAER